MTWNEKEEMKDRLRENLAEYMLRRGEVRSDRERSNPYVCVRMIELDWMGQPFLITQVDGMTCRIEKE